MESRWKRVGDSKRSWMCVCAQVCAHLFYSYKRRRQWKSRPWYKEAPVLCCCCLVAQLSWILRDPVNCSLSSSSVHRISQARILEWVAISSSRGSSRARDGAHVSALAGGFFTTEPPAKPLVLVCRAKTFCWRMVGQGRLSGHEGFS